MRNYSFFLVINKSIYFFKDTQTEPYCTSDPVFSLCLNKFYLLFIGFANPSHPVSVAFTEPTAILVFS
jgi:hypothetical protein